MKQYRLLTSNTVDELLEQINNVAEQGFELDKFIQNGTADNDWQGIAIMKKEVEEVDSVNEFDFVTPLDLKEIDPEAEGVFIVRNSDNFPICECHSEKEAIAICESLNYNYKNVLISMVD